MPQINVEFDEATMRSIDRLASKLSVKRTDLFRRLAAERSPRMPRDARCSCRR